MRALKTPKHEAALEARRQIACRFGRVEAALRRPVRSIYWPAYVWQASAQQLCSASRIMAECFCADHARCLPDFARRSSICAAHRGLAICDAVLFRGWILKSSIRLPDFNCATSQRGCLPRPAQVSEGRSGLRYFGNTGGYDRRSDTGLCNRFRRPSSCNFSCLILCSNS